MIYAEVFQSNVPHSMTKKAAISDFKRKYLDCLTAQIEVTLVELHPHLQKFITGSRLRYI